MAKKIKGIVKVLIQAGKFSPAPPVGPTLAQQGINIGDFGKKFNEATKDLAGFKIPVEVTVYEDRTYTFVLKQPPASELLKKAAGIDAGSKEPNKIKVAKISKEQLRKIAERKMADMNTTDIEAAMKTIAGTAKNMGITIE
jgi:large subunit ribosomal protein L11